MNDTGQPDNIIIEREGAPSRSSSSDLKAGYVLDNRFKLLTLLGKGGMGQVFEAMHETLQERRAIKILYSFKNESEVAVQRFLAEAQIQAKLQHPNIVRVSDAAVSADGHRFLVMELLYGESLSDWMNRTPVEQKDAYYINELVKYLIGVCNGLSHAHKHQVMHRDLKPSNIFLHLEESEPSKRIVPKILDFGVAKRLDLQDIKLTSPDGICGTVEYISPERIRGEDQDVRSDIYSVGIILYEGLTGSTPFRPEGTEGANTVLAHAVDDKYKPLEPQKLNPHVLPRLNRICMRAISKDPQKRYQSPMDLADALHSCHHSDDGQIPITDSAIKTVQTEKRRGAAIAVIACLVAVIAGAFTWPGFRRDSVEQPEPINVALSTEADFTNVPVEPAHRAPLPGLTGPVSMNTRPKNETESASNAPRIYEQTKKRAPTVIHVGPRSPSNQTKTETNTKTSSAADRPKPSRAKDLVDQGYKQLGQAHLDQARMLFNEALALEPNNSAALYGLGKVDIQAGRYERAADKIERALQRSPGNHRWRNQLAKVLKRIGKPDQAIAQWQKVLAADPDNKEARRQLGAIQKND